MQLASARHSLEVQKSSLDAIERLQRAGRGTALDVTACSRCNSCRPTCRRSRPSAPRCTAGGADRPHAGANSRQPAAMRHGARLTQTIPVGDGALLRRRPDIRQAERSRRHAASAWPRPTPRSRWACPARPAARGLFGDRGTFSWSIGPLISWTIPNTGAAQAHRPGRGRRRRRRPLRRRRAQRTARNGKRADRLCAPARRKRAASAREQSAQAASQARQLFQYGKTDYLTVLDAERTLAANESCAAAGRTQQRPDRRVPGAGRRLDGANPTAGIESAVDAGRC